MELIDTLIEARWIIPIVPKGVILENSALAVNAGRIVDILPIETDRKNVLKPNKSSVSRQALCCLGS